MRDVLLNNARALAGFFWPAILILALLFEAVKTAVLLTFAVGWLLLRWIMTTKHQ
jgi:hypothetical protein